AMTVGHEVVVNDADPIVCGNLLHNSGSYTTLVVPRSTGTVAPGINAAGQIVGAYRDAVGREHGFLLDNGNYTRLNVPGAVHTNASGINASGQIVGRYGDNSGDHVFLLDNGHYKTLDVPGQPYSPT